jgi:copper(I)-binding protein
VDVIAQPAIKRRIGIGLVAVCAALLTSACATGQEAQTANIVPAIDATNGTVGDLQLNDVSIKPPPNGPSYQLGDAAQLQLVIVNNGHVADTLQSVSSPAASGYQVFATAAEASAATSPNASSTPSTSASSTPSTSTSGTPSGSTSASGSASASTSASPSAPASGSTAPPSAPTSLAVPAGQSLSLSVNTVDPVLLIKLTKVLFPGTTVPITFTFANAGTVTLVVPVQITVNGTVGLTILPPSSSGAA